MASVGVRYINIFLTQLYSNMTSKIKKLYKKNDPSIWLLKCIALLRLYCGFYIYVSKSKLVCNLIRFYCICFSSVMNSVYIYFFRTSYFKSQYFLIFEHTFIVIIYLIYSDVHFWEYCSTIKTNDRILGFKNTSLIPSYVYFIVFVNTFMRFVITFMRIISSSANVYVFFSVSLAVTSIDLNQITMIIIFSILHSRMKQLNTFLDQIYVPINITRRNEVAISIKNIRKSLYNYNNLLDNMKCVDKQLQYMLFFSLISNSYKLIFSLYNLVKQFIDGKPLYVILNVVLETIQTLFLVSCSPMIAESTTHEVDQIRMILTKQLLRSSDEPLRFELETALQYVSLRPFSYTICRTVSFNINLPFSIISFCVTYVIVIMQLTHFTL